MSDVLKKLSVQELAAFYKRLADCVDKNKGHVKVSLAAILLKQYLKQRSKTVEFIFDPPEHLKNREPVLNVLDYHRNVFLSKEKARVGKVNKLAGTLPRLKGNPGFKKWDIRSPLTLYYESLVEMPLRYQYTGNDADKDILYALRGFQLKSTIKVSAIKASSNSNTYKINFNSWNAEVRDYYDFNYNEYITVPNPDYQKTYKNAVEPESKTIRVFHSNARRLELAHLASPYPLKSKPWRVFQPRFIKQGDITF